MKGILKFISFFHPIEIGGKDIRPEFFDFFQRNNGKRMMVTEDRESLLLAEDDSSDFVLKYENDKGGILMILEKTEGFGMSNMGAYIPNCFQKLNGRKISIELDGSKLVIRGDEKENLFGLYYTENNRCAIPDDKVKSICKPGTNNCCIFLCCGSDGFECLKFDSPSARSLLYRLATNDMNATRIGNCKILGRKEKLNSEQELKTERRNDAK